MAARKPVYSKSDLARDLKENLGAMAPSIAYCDDLVTRVFLLTRKALSEGNRVMISGCGILEVEAPRPITRKTPQGKSWQGLSRPRIKAVIQRALELDVLKRADQPEAGTQPNRAGNGPAAQAAKAKKATATPAPAGSARRK